MRAFFSQTHVLAAMIGLVLVIVAVPAIKSLVSNKDESQENEKKNTKGE